MKDRQRIDQAAAGAGWVSHEDVCEGISFVNYHQPLRPWVGNTVLYEGDELILGQDPAYVDSVIDYITARPYKGVWHTLRQALPWWR